MFEGFLNRIDTVLANVFAQTWLNISLAVTPVLVGAVTILVALYGLSIAFGRDFNFHDFMALIIRIAVTYLLITATFFFLTIIYDPVTETPGELATTIVAGTQTTNVNKLIDTFMVAGWNAIARLQAEGGIFNPGAFLLALIMMVATLLVGAVSFVVFALAKTVLTLSLMLAPVFIAFLAFQATRGWFESWLRMLFQSGLVIVLASGTMAIIMELSKDGLRTLRNATTNNNITLTDCVAYLTIAFVAVILLPQLNNIAASLAAGGASLSYHGASRAAHRAQRSLGRSDHEKAKRRWESLAWPWLREGRVRPFAILGMSHSYD